MFFSSAINIVFLESFVKSLSRSARLLVSAREYSSINCSMSVEVSLRDCMARSSAGEFARAERSNDCIDSISPRCFARSM